MASSEDQSGLQYQPVLEANSSPDAHPLGAWPGTHQPPNPFFLSNNISITPARTPPDSFRKLPVEIRNSIWEESLPDQRIFDGSTLRILNPQHGMICFDLIPSILHVCYESRNFAQRKLHQTVLIQAWPRNGRRVVYFHPERDIYKHLLTDLLWEHDLLRHPCWFNVVEVYANVGHFLSLGSKTGSFRDSFPNLQRLILTDQRTHIHEGRFSHEEINNWDQSDWLNVLSRLFGDIVASINISSTIDQIPGRLTLDILYPDTNPGLGSEEELPTSQDGPEVTLPRLAPLLGRDSDPTRFLAWLKRTQQSP